MPAEHAVDLRQLDSFVHVAELGSFSRAAAALSIAQSALSTRVRQLEVELKQPLLHRNGRGVAPTEAGKRLLQHAKGILLQVQRTREDLAALRGAPAGHIVIALPPTVARLLTVPLLKAFGERFPHATIGLIEGLSAHILEWTTIGRADVGLLFMPATSAALETKPLFAEPMYLVERRTGSTSRARQVALSQLPRYPLVLPGRPNANRTRVDSELARLGLKPQIVFELDSVASLLDAVREGLGCTVLPLSAVRAHGEGEFMVRPIVRPRIVVELSIAVSAHRPATPLARQVLAFLPDVALPLLRGQTAR